MVQVQGAQSRTQSPLIYSRKGIWKRKLEARILRLLGRRERKATGYESVPQGAQHQLYLHGKKSLTIETNWTIIFGTQLMRRPFQRDVAPLRRHYGWFFWEMMLFWEGNKLGQKSYTHNPVISLMGLEAPCCVGGLSGNCLLNIHFIF